VTHGVKVTLHGDTDSATNVKFTGVSAGGEVERRAGVEVQSQIAGAGTGLPTSCWKAIQRDIAAASLDS